MNQDPPATALPQAAARLIHWLQHQAIPLWRTQGINPRNGAHYERLLADGSADTHCDIRVRVQARQAFFFAAAAEQGWCEDGKEIARGLLDFLAKNGRNDAAGGGYVRRFNRHFQVVDHTQDLYDHAFILLANAWYYRISKDARALDTAAQTMTHIDRRFASITGGWIEGDYETPYRRQNPHMHLLESFLALHDASGEARWLARAGEIVNLFQTRFYQAEKQVLLEYFEHNWRRRQDQYGEIVEPGHMMEWVWLLDWYGRRAQRAMGQLTTPLYQQGLALGRENTGLLYDAINPQGKILNGKKRCWILTELIKASLVQTRNGHPEAEAIAIQAIDNLFKYYLCTETPGAHFEHLHADNSIAQETSPATTPYHIMMAAIELKAHCRVRENTGAV